MGAFGIALTEFVIMGILPEVARSLEVTIPQAGHFISAYALGVVLGAPLLTGLVSRWPSRRSLVVLMLWFTVFNTLSAFAEGYWQMMLVRFLSGLPHGAFFGIGAVIAARLAPEGKGAQAIAKMFAGFTIANVVGVPLGTFIGNSFHWSFSFLLVGVVGVLTVVSLYNWMPSLEVPREKDELPVSPMKNGKLWALLALTAIGTGGFFAWYSYIAPLLLDVSGHSETTVSYAMVLAGTGMVAGNFIGARMEERLGALRAIFAGMSGMSLMLVLNSFLAPFPVWVLIMCFVVGLVTFTLAAPIQIAIIQASYGSEMLASAMNQSAFNIANAIGAYLAGLPIAFGYGVIAAGRVGAVLAALGALIALGIYTYTRWRHRRGR